MDGLVLRVDPDVGFGEQLERDAADADGAEVLGGLGAQHARDLLPALTCAMLDVIDGAGSDEATVMVQAWDSPVAHDRGAA